MQLKHADAKDPLRVARGVSGTARERRNEILNHMECECQMTGAARPRPPIASRCHNNCNRSDPGTEPRDAQPTTMPSFSLHRPNRAADAPRTGDGAWRRWCPKVLPQILPCCPGPMARQPAMSSPAPLGRKARLRCVDQGVGDSVASLGIARAEDRPQWRRISSTTSSRSIRSRIEERWKTALARNACAGETRSLAGQPGPGPRQDPPSFSSRTNTKRTSSSRYRSPSDPIVSSMASWSST